MSNIDVIKTELTGDPLARGYAGMSDQAATDDLNTEYRELNKTDMTGTEVYNAIDPAEYDALTTDQQAEVWNILHLGTLNPFGLEATRMTSIFGGGSTTITSLAALRKTSISRGVDLDIGVVKTGHVEEARR